jgi:hypothetical protein
VGHVCVLPPSRVQAFPETPPARDGQGLAGAPVSNYYRQPSHKGTPARLVSGERDPRGEGESALRTPATSPSENSNGRTSGGNKKSDRPGATIVRVKKSDGDTLTLEVGARFLFDCFKHQTIPV